ncbi:condensation domain-containing protein [Nonomuraea turkmeniaca]|uniref:condensation domain-containing protein n=1 Tax=Nonomuraea turkmeniaca TaxID=103838 RepID=UPI001B868B01|nr:condensation domain-containing protein [Nonomuraea turkmeniaca]
MKPLNAENALRRAWAEALGDVAACDGDFFAHGGDSLRALAVSASVLRQLGVTLDPRWLYDVPRFADALADLQARAGQKSGGAVGEIAAGPREGDHPLSFQQEGLLAWGDRFGERHHHRLAYAVAVPAGTLDGGRLRAAVALAGRRHPALRTTVYDGRQHVDDRRLELHTISSTSSAQLDAARAWCAQGFANGGPLASAALIGGAEEDVVVLAAHQLVMDPWSWGLFLREVSARYSAPDAPADNADGRVPAYSDYARWQRRYLTGAVYAEHLEFWRTVAAGFPAEGVPLPGSTVGAAPAGPAARLPVAVPAALVTDLQALGRRRDASLFHVLLALFHAAVAAWAGVPEVVVGSATANRTVPGTDQTVGFFVNGRFTRAEPARHATLADLIAGVRDGWRAGDAHQELHLEKTVFDLGVPDLVNVKFSLDSIPTLDPLPELGGRRLRPVRLAEAATARRHLAVSLSRAGGGLAGGLIYRTDLLTTGDAAALLERFHQVMCRAVTEWEGR